MSIILRRFFGFISFNVNNNAKWQALSFYLIDEVTAVEILFDLLLITEVHTTTVVSRVSNAGSTNPIQIGL